MNRCHWYPFGYAFKKDMLFSSYSRYFVRQVQQRGQINGMANLNHTHTHTQTSHPHRYRVSIFQSDW